MPDLGSSEQGFQFMYLWSIMKDILSIDPKTLSTHRLHGYLLGSVGPRPIALASTVDEKGMPNLAPFSFFNVFSANPPIMIFSPARRVRDNTTKHTLENILETMEVVINVVNHAMVHQMSLTSTEYPSGENEFKKAGLTMLASEMVSPFRVAESPVQFECKVNKVEPLGKEGGAGNLVFSEVQRIHLHTAVLDSHGSIDQSKIDLVARMGGNWYSRANMGMFEVPKPLSSLGIGVDAIPARIRLSKLLTGNDLGMLGNVEKLPTKEEIAHFVGSDMRLRAVISSGEREQLEALAKEYLAKNEVDTAWKVLLAE